MVDPGWLIFFAIPIFYVLFGDQNNKKNKDAKKKKHKIKIVVDEDDDEDDDVKIIDEE